jgi:hypothetical protein
MSEPARVLPEPRSEESWHLSATQLETLRACPKKYYYQYVEGLPRPQHPSAALGSEVHTLLETSVPSAHWLGEAPEFPDTPAGKLAAKLHEQWADTRRFMLLASETDLKWADSGYLWRAKQDLVLQERDTNFYWIGDHKTTSDLKKWAKTGSQLRSDTQALLYARSFFGQVADIDTVGLRWAYVQTKGAPDTRVVEEVVTREHVEGYWPKLLTAADEAKKIRLGVVEPKRNKFHCNAYGGCPFRSTCEAAEFGRKATMGFLAKAKAANQTAPTATDSLPPPPAELVQDLRARITSFQATKAAQSSPPPAPAAAAPEAPKRPRARRPAINPPENIGPTPPEPAPAAPAPAVVEPDGSKSAAILAAEPDATDAVLAFLEKTSPVVVPARQTMPTPPPSPAPAPASIMRKETLIGTLYVDCLPLRETPTELSDLLGLIEPPEEGHYRLVEYGKGPAMLSLAVLQTLREQPVDALAMSLETPEGRDLYVTLSGVAGKVVKGL